MDGLSAIYTGTIISCRSDNSDTPRGPGGYGEKKLRTIGSGETVFTGTNNAGTGRGGGPVTTDGISVAANGGTDSSATYQDYHDTRKGRYLYRLDKDTNEKEHGISHTFTRGSF